MSITATELKQNLGRYLLLAATEDVYITKNGKKETLQAKDPSKGAIDQNLARLNNEEKRLKKTKKELQMSMRVSSTKKTLLQTATTVYTTDM